MMDSLASYASLLIEKSNMTMDEITEKRRIDSRKKVDPLVNAKEICERYNLRGRVFPCRWVDRENDPLKEQEFKDALKLTRWKLALKGNRAGYGICSDEVRDFLDAEMPGWRDDNMKRSASLKHAQDIVRRYVVRGKALPRPLYDKDSTDSIRLQEHKDYQKLLTWCKSLNGIGRKCPSYIFQYLDKEIPGWTNVAKFPRKGSNSMSLNQESEGEVIAPPHVPVVQAPQTEIFNLGSTSHDDSDLSEGGVNSMGQKAEVHPSGAKVPVDPSANKKRPRELNISSMFDVTNGPLLLRPTVYQQPYIDDTEGAKKPKLEPIVHAQEIVKRYHQRGNILPCRWADRKNNPVKELEFKDALKLTRWKLALKGNRAGYGICSDEVRDYLDTEMPGWRFDRSSNKRSQPPHTPS